MRVVLKAYVDRSFTFIVKPPPSSWFLKKAAGIEKGSNYGAYQTIGQISIKYLYEIAKIKKEIDPEMNNHSLEGIVRCLVAQTKTLGLEVVEDTPPPKPLKIDV